LPVEIKVTGAEQFRDIARTLRGISKSKALRNELARAINKATKPLKTSVKRSARARLPWQGGLGRKVARAKMATKVKLAGETANVSIVAIHKYDLEAIDRGRVRHPTFGHHPWVIQLVQPGYWTRPLVEGSPGVRREIVGAIETIAKKIERGS